MKTNNPSSSDKMKNQAPEQDVNESSYDRKNKNQNQSVNSNKNMNSGSQGNMGSNYSQSNYGANKGTGMSSEAGSNQGEKSWQSISGSQSGSGMRDMNQSKGLRNMNTDYVKNQSDQQRRASMDNGTPEKEEKDMKNSSLGDEELNDVDWSDSDSENK